MNMANNIESANTLLTIWSNTISFAIECLQLALIPCLPAIAAEFIAAEVDKIKLCLLNEFVDEYARTKQKSEEIKDFLDYVNARPYRFRIWRTIDVDASLLVGLVSLCTTYLIVIIQFTHLY
ncbi:hypothetical protein EVAR_101878_1 [Eumeta japonica]|uniref:Gustatory receptor n=1 Tax=Eumeta variegata TaxID=151549 RepID=A0A4C1SN88_EUMVA|nr:hypothetical protein EVAR_101878_1 [Eumeta japonica]